MDRDARPSSHEPDFKRKTRDTLDSMQPRPRRFINGRGFTLIELAKFPLIMAIKMGQTDWELLFAAGNGEKR